MATFVYPYTTGSKSAMDLAATMGVKRMRRTGSTVLNTPNNKIINWGSGDFPIDRYNRAVVINKPQNVLSAVDKLRAFRAMEAAKVNIPAYTTDRTVALRWSEDGGAVVARATTTGNSSSGLTIHDTSAGIPVVPLYTKYIPKTSEYRIHVIDGNVAIIQKKVFPSSKDSTGVDFRIRDIRQGFVFQTTKIAELESKQIIHQAIEAVDALGLDFGGVDVIWNNTQNRAYVLEVNTAPGIEGTDLTSYSTALSALIERLSR